MNAFDPGIPQLRQVLEPQAATQLLCDVLPGLTGAGSRVVGVELLKHRLGRRCALAYAVEGQHGRARLFAKVFARDRGQAVFRTTRRLRRALRHSDAIGIPRALAYLPEQHMLVTEFVEGSRLMHYDGRSAEAAGRIAEALDAVHALEPHGKRSWDFHKELENTLHWTAVLRTHRPDLADPVAGLERALTKLSADVEIVFTGLVHRDLYPEQFIDANGHTVLLDWDDARTGDGAVDVGNLLAHLSLRAIQFPESAAPCGEARGSFLERYRPTNGHAAASWAERIRAYEATSLLRLAGVYSARKRWVDAIPQSVIAACEAVLQEEVVP